jgi:hypothetical protein
LVAAPPTTEAPSARRPSLVAPYRDTVGEDRVVTWLICVDASPPTTLAVDEARLVPDTVSVELEAASSWASASRIRTAIGADSVPVEATWVASTVVRDVDSGITSLLLVATAVADGVAVLVADAVLSPD